VVIEIGGLPVRLRVSDPSSSRCCRTATARVFVTTTSEPRFEFDIDLQPPDIEYQDQEVEVEYNAGEMVVCAG